jgi:ribulose 1,5-bisphosphate synthetase/thiazole synthase
MEKTIIVVGGGIRGCISAITAAKEGHKVILVEQRCFLGNELTATYRPWIGKKGFEKLDEETKEMFFDENEKNEIEADDEWLEYAHKNEIPLFVGTVKKCLFELMNKYRINVIYMSHIVGIVECDRIARGIVIANKFGVQKIEADLIIDSTTKQILKRILKNIEQKEECIVSQTFEYQNVLLPNESIIFVPKKYGIMDNKIIIHCGKRQNGQVYIEFNYKESIDLSEDMEAKKKLEYDIREKALEAAAYLKVNVSYFKDGQIIQGSHELFIRRTTQMNDESNFEVENIMFLVKNKNIGLEVSFEEIYDIKESIEKQIKSELLKTYRANKTVCKDCKLCKINIGYAKIPLLSSLTGKITDLGEYKLEQIEISDSTIFKIKKECNVLVAGGGTGGSPAAISATRCINDVVVVDFNPILGGTQSLGYVAGYYNGYKLGFSAEHFYKLEEVIKSINGTVDSRYLHYFRAYCYENEIINNKGKILTNTIICGSVKVGKKIKGIIVADENGIGVISSKIIVDATGDGDVAYFGGAKYNFGDDRDGNIQTSSQWGLGKGGCKDLDFVNHQNINELFRGLELGHKKGNYYDFASFYTVRESRRFKAYKKITMADIFEKRHYKDVIAMAQTDCDPHGVMSSVLARMGYTPYHNELIQLEIPYDACIPKDLDGILIAGKSLCASRDALAYARMTADVQNRGFSLGLAAAMAVIYNESLRKIPIKELQRILIVMGVLPKNIFENKKKSLTEKEKVSKLIGGTEQDLLEVLCCAKNKTVAYLLEKFDDNTIKDKILIAKALAWFGYDNGADLLIGNLKELNKVEGKSLYDNEHPWKEGNNKGGAIGGFDTYWQINQLLILIGMANINSANEILRKIVEKTEAGGSAERDINDYVKGRIDLHKIAHYDRILALCFCAERIPNENLIKAFEQLLEKPFIGGHIIKDKNGDMEHYMSAYLELIIARTAARCGSKKAIELLIEYTNDVHSILSNNATKELKEIMGNNFGVDIKDYKENLIKLDKVPPKPYFKRVIRF